MKIYKSYSFRDKDPVIDRLRTIIQDQGARRGDIENASGVTSQTLHNWFEGPTRRPSHACVAAVAAALGYRFVLEKGQDAKIIPLRRRAK